MLWYVARLLGWLSLGIDWSDLEITNPPFQNLDLQVACLNAFHTCDIAV